MLDAAGIRKNLVRFAFFTQFAGICQAAKLLPLLC